MKNSRLLRPPLLIVCICLAIFVGTTHASNDYKRADSLDAISKRDPVKQATQYETYPSPQGPQAYFQENDAHHCNGPGCYAGGGHCDYRQVPRGSWRAAFEFTFLQPRFENNVAFTIMESDGDTFESFQEVEFDYDLDFTPRVWLVYEFQEGSGARVTYWQFDHAANSVTASPPENGFGQITHPPFGAVDISTTIPSDVFSTASDLNAYVFDAELTRTQEFACWSFAASVGLRYASVKQTYRAQLRDDQATLLGSIDFAHDLRGVGPTLSVMVGRPLPACWTAFAAARGSLLFGEGESRLVAGEDLDLTSPFNTRRANSRDDLFSIGELQLGLEWSPCCRGCWKPFLRGAFEGQLWSGVGNATSEEGDLGFVGFNLVAGLRL